MGQRLILTLNVADGVNVGDVVDLLNGDILCVLEEERGLLVDEDDKNVSAWQWIYPPVGKPCCSHLYESACECCIGECPECEGQSV